MLLGFPRLAGAFPFHNWVKVVPRQIVAINARHRPHSPFIPGSFIAAACENSIPAQTTLGIFSFFSLYLRAKKLAKGRGYYNPIIPPLQAIFHQIIRHI